MEIKSTEKLDPEKESIAIIGSGDFGRALALRMIQSNFNVIIGSRNPEGNTK